ncbi:MAG TPA: hypothetical protein VMD91_15130 [Candidatus Sulfotelmatobacter sp.]|nr:hypothetical protein [Candidatus Sulfotelmatobacter sp.]
MTTNNTEPPAEPHFGFKAVTLDNVLTVDPIVATMVKRERSTGDIYHQEPEDWVPVVLAIELDARVPWEIRRMFAFSRGAMCYAGWYYPALTLGAHDMLRIADSAAAAACRERGINQPIGKRFFTFEQNIKALSEAGIIEPSDVRLWNIIRDQRNRTTHPAAQHIYDFAFAYDVLKIVRDLINRLDWLQA